MTSKVLVFKQGGRLINIDETASYKYYEAVFYMPHQTGTLSATVPG
jgi:hypothetical protein